MSCGGKTACAIRCARSRQYSAVGCVGAGPGRQRQRGCGVAYSGGTATVDSVGLAGGAVAESDEELRERLLQRIRNPPMAAVVRLYPLVARGAGYCPRLG
ncbi:baseplate J/gp47 family protein [Neisseria subflava]|uniref:baseplate J/gp47 family protein n=1 Tax=Neisseria subflava TaxID=28449 RepID=UPI003D6E37A0